MIYLKYVATDLLKTWITKFRVNIALKENPETKIYFLLITNISNNIISQVENEIKNELNKRITKRFKTEYLPGLGVAYKQKKSFKKEIELISSKYVHNHLLINIYLFCFFIKNKPQVI
jgi:hypothetical protein